MTLTKGSWLLICPSCNREYSDEFGLTKTLRCRCGYYGPPEKKRIKTMKIERWAFTSQELLDPSKCKRDDEFAVLIGGMRNGKYEPHELPVLVYRNGKCSNRWGDGTVGVSTDDSALAEMEDDLYTLDYEDSTSEWRDVVTDDEGNFISFHGVKDSRSEKKLIERLIDTRSPIIGACYCKSCHALALITISSSGQTIALCSTNKCSGYAVAPVRPCEWVPVEKE